jgi:hypothetical protein
VSADIRNELARTQLPFGVKAGCPMEDWMAERKKGHVKKYYETEFVIATQLSARV